jgi:phage portal protein BeeE
MQFLELRNFTAEKIREAYGVSKSMLGIVDDVNRANNEAQEANYAKYKLKPRLERFKQALNNEFLPLFGTTTVGLEFDYDDIEIEDTSKVIADRDSRVQAAVALINAGADPVATMKAFNLPEIPFINRSDNGQVQN